MQVKFHDLGFLFIFHFRNFFLRRTVLLITFLSCFFTTSAFGKFTESNLDSVHKVIAEKFDVELLQKFYTIYGNEFSDEIKNENYRRALLAERLQLELSYNEKEFRNFDEFIKIAAPSDKAFLALQNLIAADIKAKKWKTAATVVRKYQPFFGYNNLKITHLLEMLNSSTDASVTVKPLAETVNTEQGGEFSPVFPSGEKRMYFCGTGRSDNIGGEDIFVSERVGDVWAKPQVINEFSTSKFNDAPLSISGDGTQMLFVRNGKFYTAQKTSVSWTIPKFLEGPFYSFGNVLDGAFIPDGKGILFTTLKPDKLSSLFPEMKDSFQQTDIFICLQDDNNNWSQPINLGSAINTRQNERSPFLHVDMKTLYFSSDGHGGFGKMDVYKSVRLSDTCWTCWSEPENIGKELNTTGDDIGFKINVNGDKAFFARSDNAVANVSLLLLIDISGSMVGQKLEKVKLLANNILNQTVNTNTETAIISYAGQCNAPLTDSCGFDASLRLKHQFVDNLVTAGKTTTSEAYKAAVLYLQRNSHPGTRQKFIIVLTDEDVCVCNKADIAFKLMQKSGTSGVCQTLVFDVSEDSVLFSNFKTENPVSFPSKLLRLFQGMNNNTFSSDNLRLTGSEDLYEAVLPLKMRPGVVSTISGKIKDIAEKPVSATVVWNDITSEKNIGVLYSDPADGSYYLVLPHGKFYTYYAQADSLLNESYHLDLKSEIKAKHLENDMRLFKIEDLVNSGEALSLNNVFFNFDESTLLPASIAELKRWAEIIKNRKLKVEISGHTDSVGGEQYNLKLSEKRAEAVRIFLISQGCNPELLIAIGYGKSKPENSNDTEKGRARNRRVELKIKGLM